MAPSLSWTYKRDGQEIKYLPYAQVSFECIEFLRLAGNAGKVFLETQHVLAAGAHVKIAVFMNSFSFTYTPVPPAPVPPTPVVPAYPPGYEAPII